MVVIISQFMNVYNQSIVHLNLHNVMCQFYLNKPGKKKENTYCSNTKAIKKQFHFIRNGIVIDLVLTSYQF